MKDIRVDAEGEFRCWNCGNKGLLEKRTFRSKVLLGVGSLLAKKKLKCQTCDEYNDTGNARPFDGPASRKWRKRWEKIEASKSQELRATEARQAHAHADALARSLLEAAAEARAEATPAATPGHLTAAGPTGELSRFAGDGPPRPGDPPPPPPAWGPDPTGRHELRYWDGLQWTNHVADSGLQGTDDFNGTGSEA